MSTSLGERLGGEAPVLWLDFYDYAAELFAGPGGIAWFDDAAFAAFHAKAQSLLRSDVVALPVARVAAALLEAQPALREAMKAKARPAYPLRRLLEAEPLREAVAALLKPLRAAASDRPLALVIPSPQAWLGLAWEAAWGTALPAEVARDPDEIDGAAVYVADFLRGFAESGLDLVLLCEDTGTVENTPVDLSLYGPVSRIARHYRWEIGVLDGGRDIGRDGIESIDFRIGLTASGDSNGPGFGAMLPAGFWHGDSGALCGRGRLSYGVVPSAAVPETVLDRIAFLRAWSS